MIAKKPQPITFILRCCEKNFSRTAWQLIKNTPVLHSMNDENSVNYQKNDRRLNTRNAGTDPPLKSGNRLPA